MNTQIRSALTLVLLLTFLTGVLYPLVVTGLAQTLFPGPSNGSLIEKDGQIIGSTLIGQNFTNPRYFWPRPSATAGHLYNAFDPVALTGSSGSNLGPLSFTLVDAVRQRVGALRAAYPDNAAPIPVDLVTASASGLDPHISLASAYFQVTRVAQARGWSQVDVKAIVDACAEGRQLGFLGEARVNVLLLNLALDAYRP